MRRAHATSTVKGGHRAPGSVRPGVLRAYYIDTYNAKKMDTEPTISGIASVLLMENGEKELNGLVADLGRSILVTGFNGGNCNSSIRRLLVQDRGFLVENGALTTPLAEMNVTGNVIDLWNGLAETNDRGSPRRSVYPPSCLKRSISAGCNGIDISREKG